MMLDGTYFFECQCGADEHTLRFTLDVDEDFSGIHVAVFLDRMYPL